MLRAILARLAAMNVHRIALVLGAATTGASAGAELLSPTPARAFSNNMWNYQRDDTGAYGHSSESSFAGGQYEWTNIGGWYCTGDTHYNAMYDGNVFFGYYHGHVCQT
jgi:hypothetical protein